MSICDIAINENVCYIGGKYRTQHDSSSSSSCVSHVSRLYKEWETPDFSITINMMMSKIIGNMSSNVIDALKSNLNATTYRRFRGTFLESKIPISREFLQDMVNFTNNCTEYYAEKETFKSPEKVAQYINENPEEEKEEEIEINNYEEIEERVMPNGVLTLNSYKAFLEALQTPNVAYKTFIREMISNIDGIARNDLVKLLFL